MVTRKTFTVRDTKTGKVIRKGTFGESIGEVKLRSRARRVRETIKSTTVSETEARERAKQDLELIARKEQLKTAEIRAEKIEKAKKELLAEEEKISKLQAEKQKQQQFKKLKSEDLQKVLTKQQQKRVITRLSTVSRGSPKLNKALNSINSGIIKQPTRITTKALNTLEDLRQQAIKGNRNAEAAIIGIASLPVARVDVALDTFEGLKSLLNLKETAIALASLSSSDIRKAGAGFGSRIMKGDSKALVDFVTIFAPTKIPKLDSLIKKINAPSKLIQSATSKWIYDGNVLKGSASIKIITDGLTQANQKIKVVTDLSLRPKQKTVFGTVKTTIGKKTTTKKINLQDAGTFYIDKATGLKILKEGKGISEAILKSKQLKTIIKTKKGETRAAFEGFITTGQKKVIERKTLLGSERITGLSKTETFNFEKALGVDPQGRRILAFRENSRQIDSIKSSFLKPAPKRTPKDWNRLIKFLEFVEYDIPKSKGFTNRIRFGQALIANRKAKKSMLANLDNDFKQGFIIQRAKIRATGSFETINPTRFSMGPSFLLDSPSLLKKVKKTKTGVAKLPQEIVIPDLEALIYLPTKLSKGVRIPGRFARIAAKIGLYTKYKFKDITTAQDKVLRELQKKSLKDIITQTKKKVQKKATKQDQTKKKVQKKVTTKKTVSKTVTKKTVQKKVLRPRPKTKPVKKTKKLRVPGLSLTFDTKLPKGTRLKFDGVYKSKGKFKTLKLGLPLNKARAKIATLVDSTTARSMKLKIVGTTKAKDIRKPSIIKKFKPKISKDNKVLKLVEKSKNSIDTPGEKKGLSIAKAIQQQKKKKIVKKPTKKKKSSTIKRKVIKTKKKKGGKK